MYFSGNSSIDILFSQGNIKFERLFRKIVNIYLIYMEGQFVLYDIDFLNGNQPKLDLV